MGRCSGGLITQGFLRLRFGGLIFGRAYFFFSWRDGGGGGGGLLPEFYGIIVNKSTYTDSIQVHESSAGHASAVLAKESNALDHVYLL